MLWPRKSYTVCSSTQSLQSDWQLYVYRYECSAHTNRTLMNRRSQAENPATIENQYRQTIFAFLLFDSEWKWQPNAKNGFPTVRLWYIYSFTGGICSLPPVTLVYECNSSLWKASNIWTCRWSLLLFSDHCSLSIRKDRSVMNSHM